MLRNEDLKDHEALHMSAFLMRSVAAELLEHDAIHSRPEWRQLAERAHQALFDLYQAIGQAAADR
ncbi:MAG: hypothetical protein Q8R98_12760 [Rubrivivax sp.]|nr:hypothetical protein [Rubrivivax sp.]MDP3612718.1 hypothetical protein [Rubrivivax sp.]